jgi:GT2 family glycosyltransferase
MAPQIAPVVSRPALCVINYNGAGHLRDSLPGVAGLRHQFGDVILVDDASTDDSVAVMERLLPQARIVRLTENRGPGAARNAGLRATRATRVLFMDNDVLPDAELAPTLGAALDAAPSAVMAVPRVVSREDPDRIEYEGGDAHVSGLMRLRAAGASARSAPAEGEVAAIGTLVTCCFLLDRTRWGQDDLFDERLRIYLEDHELGLRARMRNLDILAVPAAVCQHGDGTPGLSIRATGRHTPERIRNTILNRWQVILKLYEGRTLILMAPYLALFEIYQLAGCVVLGWGGHWWEAARELSRRSADIRTRRRAFQAARVLGDASVLSAGPHPFNPALARRAPVRLLHATLDMAASLNWSLVRRLDRSEVGS